jgi:circadian clock protein KaiB
MDEPDDKLKFELELFVVGRSAKAEAAISNLRALCETFLKGRYDITVIDVLEDPMAAERANVIATPLLIRNSPRPRRRIVGDLSMTNVLLHGLGIEVDRPRGMRGGDRTDG